MRRFCRPLLEYYFRGEENFAGGHFREIPFAVDVIFAGGKFRAKSKFANIAKNSSTRKIIQYYNNNNNHSSNNNSIYLYSDMCAELKLCSEALVTTCVCLYKTILKEYICRLSNINKRSFEE